MLPTTRAPSVRAWKRSSVRGDSTAAPRPSRSAPRSCRSTGHCSGLRPTASPSLVLSNLALFARTLQLPGPTTKVRRMGNELYGPQPGVAADAGWTDDRPRMGFFTDTSVCIGCKGFEVACKEWHGVPDDGFNLLGSSYDNTGELGASTWRHVAFIEQPKSVEEGSERPDFRWLMESDVCKHCTHAACLDVCPTGSLFRTEFGTVVVQQDICNGCGYCVVGCPFGVIDRSPLDGRAHKCTLCYDRLKDGLTPACAKACPTESIQFGPLDEPRERADRRLADLHQQGVTEAELYGRNPDDGVGGHGSLFLLLGGAEVDGVAPAPGVPPRFAPQIWRRVGAAAVAFAAAAIGAFVSSAAGTRR